MKTLIELSSGIEKRRRELGLNQSDMLMKIGMSQQQYQRVEAGHDIRVSTLLRILEGMELELLIVPRDQVRRLESLLRPDEHDYDLKPAGPDWQDKFTESSWSSMLKDFEDE